jgi:hypothetical protein
MRYRVSFAAAAGVLSRERRPLLRFFAAGAIDPGLPVPPLPGLALPDVP